MNSTAYRPRRRRIGRKLLEANKDSDDVMGCYRRIHGHLKRLTVSSQIAYKLLGLTSMKLNADLSTWKIVDEQATVSNEVAQIVAPA